MQKKELLVLGGAGFIGKEVVKDLANTGDFSKITIIDYNIKEAKNLIDEIDDDRFTALKVDVENKEKLIEQMNKHDLVCNCLPFNLTTGNQEYDKYITECCLEASTPGIDLGATKDQLELHNKFQESELEYVVCCGITPGTSNVIAGLVGENYDQLKTVEIGFASYRAIATAPGLVKTTLWEVDPKETGRMYYQDGEYIEVPPFSGAKKIKFPPPIGPQEAYYVPHNEVYTIPRSYPQVEKVEVRGTWTPKTRRILKFLYDYGFYTTPPVEINDQEISPMEFMKEFVFANEDLAKEELWGFGLVVNIEAIKENSLKELSFYTKHPPAEEWGGIPAVYVKNTALSMSVGVQLLARGVNNNGILTPDQAFDHKTYINELKERGLIVHERNGEFNLPK